MHNRLYFILLFSFVVACQKAPLVSVIGQEQIVFNEQGGSKELLFTANRDWNITPSEPWVQITPRTGTSSKEQISVSVSCDPNPFYEERNATIRIDADGVSSIVSVVQEQSDVILADVLEYDISHNGGVIPVDVSTNVEFDINCSESWVVAERTKALSSASLNISVQENTTYRERSASILLKQKNGDIIINLTIRQRSNPPIDLSENGTANCYIVPLDNAKYSFCASVKGNTNEEIHGCSVASMWEKTQDNAYTTILDGLEFDKEKETIQFFLTGTSGNALVALIDEDGVIIWSWHIWVTDYQPGKDYCTFKDGTVLMQRNLGALAENDGGLMYQWGRKDPFHTIRSQSSDYMKAREEDYFNQNPTVFYSGNFAEINENYKWYTFKDINDPCPAGWRVFGEGSSEKFAAYYRNNTLVIPEPDSIPACVFPLNTSSRDHGNNVRLDLWLCTYWRQYSACAPYSFCHYGGDTDYKQVSFYSRDNVLDDSRTIGKPVRCQRIAQ